MSAVQAPEDKSPSLPFTLSLALPPSLPPLSISLWRSLSLSLISLNLLLMPREVDARTQDGGIRWIGLGKVG